MFKVRSGVRVQCGSQKTRQLPDYGVWQTELVQLVGKSGGRMDSRYDDLQAAGLNGEVAEIVASHLEIARQ